ncbi:MAG: methyltransferase [Bacteroidetes bacterium]|nr:methyltransferase [Bacteroidota bacterium]
MKETVQKIYATYLLKPYLKRYLKKERFYHYNNKRLKIYPTVFHPKYFFSTQILLQFLETLDLKEKTFCEVGAGSGVISYKAWENGASITAIEMNEIAIKGLKENFGSMQNFEIIQSDLFENVGKNKFDIVMINPPYYFKEIESEESLAWHCGQNGEYFHKLFKQLSAFIHKSSEMYIILFEDCETERIENIARDYNFSFTKVFETKMKWEKNYIFNINYLWS